MLGFQNLRFGLLRQTCIPVAMMPTDDFHLRALLQLVLAVLSYRLEQPVTCLTAARLHEHQRFLDQRGDDVEHLICVSCLTGAYSLRGLERKTASKHREPTEDGPFMC